MDAAIALQGVTKSFGAATAVDALDLVIPRGGLYGFIGPNGAGKTTTIRMIMSIIMPDAGAISVFGHGSALAAKDRIGYLPEERGVYRKMRVGAFLAYIARLKGVAESDLASRITRLLNAVGLSDTERKRCEELSKGMRQKIQFVAATIHQPDLLILDEPFSGLDPISMRLLRDLILAEHRRGATILFSTHVMAQAEEICEHVVMLHQGRKVLDEPLVNIKRRFDPRAVKFEPIDPRADLGSLRVLRDVEQVRPGDGAFEIRLREGSDPAAAMQRIAAAVAPARIELARPRLEDVFVGIVAQGTLSADAAATLRASVQMDSAAEQQA